MRLVDTEQVYCSICEEKGVCEKVTCDVKKMPTTDAVPVVRCRECRWFNNAGCAIWIDDDAEINPKEDDFCSFGKRKEADHEVSES